MKSCTRWFLALLVVAAPLMMVVHSASANTELVPAARLLGPYWDVSGSRSTLLLLTNASLAVDLTGPQGRVHLEFYDKTCSRHNVPIELSPGDIDQFDLKNSPTDLTQITTLPSKKGWIDVDVRSGSGGRDRPSIQYNVLMGTIVISDSASDFALAYPMASSIGSSSQGVGGDIVTRSGTSVQWSGRFEPFPSRVFVAAFFADGGPLNTTSQLLIAGPANGNFGGLSDGTVGEAPGADLGGATTILIDSEPQIFDGCENFQSTQLFGHYIDGSLTALFGAGFVDQSNWNTGTNCGTSVFPNVDEVSGAFVGWIEIPNLVESSTGFPRGLVGVLAQSASAGSVQQGDVGRLWGDPCYGGIGRELYTGPDGKDACRYEGNFGGTYSLINKVTNKELYEGFLP
jgi:hypothetical protein